MFVYFYVLHLEGSDHLPEELSRRIYKILFYD